MHVSGIAVCSLSAKDSPLLSRNLALRFSCYVQPCNIGRSEDQRKRNPRPQEASKHLHTSENQKRYDKEVERDHDAYEEKRSLQWRRVVEPLEVAHRQEQKEDGGSYRMDGECSLQRQQCPPDAYRGKTQRPPNQGIDNNDHEFLAFHYLLLSMKAYQLFLSSASRMTALLSHIHHKIQMIALEAIRLPVKYET
jgi:hypothetical protein